MREINETSTTAYADGHNVPVCRQKAFLMEVNRLYPSLWKSIDKLRAGRKQTPFSWPDWCFCPLIVYKALFDIDPDIKLNKEETDYRAALLLALCAWRVTQGIYRFDATLQEEIIATSIDEILPYEIFYQIPEWCVYIETPGMIYDTSPLFGYWACLSPDFKGETLILCLFLDLDNFLFPIAIPLGNWSLQEAIYRAILKSDLNLEEQTNSLKKNLQPLIALLLYLCSTSGEIGTGEKRPSNPKPKKTKSGLRIFPPDQPTVWDVGIRIGAALRKAYKDTDTQKMEVDPITGRARPRPHVRRAHWHTYLSGEKRSQRLVKWQPPIFVRVDNADNLPVVIHPVSPSLHHD